MSNPENAMQNRTDSARETRRDQELLNASELVRLALRIGPPAAKKGLAGP